MWGKANFHNILMKKACFRAGKQAFLMFYGGV